MSRRRLSRRTLQRELLRRYYRALLGFATLDPALVRELRTSLARLELVSHGSSTNLGSRPGAHDSRPPSDRFQEFAHTAEEREALRGAYHGKTLEYFQTRIAKCKSLAELAEIRTEVDETVAAWVRTPLPKGQEPAFGSPQWKRWVGESEESSRELARRFNCSHVHILKVRKAYREAA